MTTSGFKTLSCCFSFLSFSKGFQQQLYYIGGKSREFDHQATCLLNDDFTYVSHMSVVQHIMNIFYFVKKCNVTNYAIYASYLSKR